MTPKEVIPKVQQDLFAMQDLEYRDFHAKLMPTVEKESVIGVRVPVLRTYAKKFGKTEEAKQFLKILPHQYYEENNLHGLLIEQIKDYELCIEELERFLPHIDNWATCDLLAVRTVKNHLNSYIKKIDRWLESEHIYTIRFGINMLMRYYLEEDCFRVKARKIPGNVAQIDNTLAELLNQMTDSATDDAILDADGANHGADNMESRLLSGLKQNPYITQTDLAKELSLSRRTVQRIMKELMNDGKIKRVGSTRTGHWEIND